MEGNMKLTVIDPYTLAIPDYVNQRQDVVHSEIRVLDMVLELFRWLYIKTHLYRTLSLPSNLSESFRCV